MQLIRRIVVFVIPVLLVIGFIALIHADVSRVPMTRRYELAQVAAGAQAADQASGTLHRKQVPHTDSYDFSRPLSDKQQQTIASKAEQTAQASGKPQHNFTYCVTSEGNVGDIGEFERTIYATLNDPHGWPRAGLTFTPSTDANACDMTFVLAEAQTMKSFAQGCSEQYSCRVGNSVIMNADRWNAPTDSWNQGGGSLANYRTMVINHETGHRLGHADNETVCPAPGEPAPLMQQQSMSLRGCTINEWPLDSELWARW